MSKESPNRSSLHHTQPVPLIPMFDSIKMGRFLSGNALDRSVKEARFHRCKSHQGQVKRPDAQTIYQHE
ncbi:hypothetical protein [Sphingobium sp. CFD-1]|uniref:hypothetical protein n=1 Tax=Sphingobium sp. CFD-1 TaxID=2878545 RepID=UPI00214BAC75|nr:hypothetical protein [Sphingobium sp. CFD-1]